jgi:hypothetical protein
VDTLIAAAGVFELDKTISSRKVSLVFDWLAGGRGTRFIVFTNTCPLQLWHPVAFVVQTIGCALKRID